MFDLTDIKDVRNVYHTFVYKLSGNYLLLFMSSRNATRFLFVTHTGHFRWQNKYLILERIDLLLN